MSRRLSAAGVVDRTTIGINGHDGAFAAWKHLDRIARRDAAARDPAPDRATLIADAAVRGRYLVATLARHVLNGQRQRVRRRFACGRQALEQLKQRGPAVPRDVERLGHVVPAQRRHGHDAGDFDPSLLANVSNASRTAE